MLACMYATYRLGLTGRVGFRADGATAKLSVRVRGQASLKPKMFSIEHTKERWYEKYFFDKPHQNYVGKHEELGAVALSLAKEKMETDVRRRRRR